MSNKVTANVGRVTSGKSDANPGQTRPDQRPSATIPLAEYNKTRPRFLRGLVYWKKCVILRPGTGLGIFWRKLIERAMF